MYKIYGLVDPNTMLIRYIGVTTGSLNARLAHHVYEGRYDKGTHKVHWINSLLQQNKKPIIKLIEEIDTGWEDRERYWIAFYSNLTNTKEGGTGVVLNRTKSSIQSSIEGHELEILQLSIEGEVINKFSSISKAQKATKISRTNIGNVLAKRAITAGGYHWVYVREYTSKYKIKINNEKSLFGIRFNKKQIIATYKDNTEQIFNSVGECANHFEFSQSMISLVLSGKRKLKDTTLRYSLI